MTHKKQTTIKEIARKLKISPSTVSRALNDHPSIGLVTTMRVKKTAEELQYEPNQTAIFFKQRKTFTIGVILPNLSEPFFAEAISAIEDVAVSKSYTVLLGQSLDDEKRERDIINSFKKHRVDGILMSLSKNTINLDFIDMLSASQIPLVFFDCVPDRTDVDKVWCDLSSGMKEAVEAFVARGHQRIALINGPNDLPASKQRKEAFANALREQKIELDERYAVNTDLTHQGNQYAMEQICSIPDRPSAIICFNDYVTLDVIQYAKQKGFSLTRNIFFISYANYSLWQYMDNPPLGSVEQYVDRQALSAAEVLFHRIESRADSEKRNTVYHSKLVLT